MAGQAYNASWEFAHIENPALLHVIQKMVNDEKCYHQNCGVGKDPFFQLNIAGDLEHVSKRTMDLWYTCWEEVQNLRDNEWFTFTTSDRKLYFWCIRSRFKWTGSRVLIFGTSDSPDKLPEWFAFMASRTAFRNERVKKLCRKDKPIPVTSAIEKLGWTESFPQTFAIAQNANSASAK